MWIFKILSYWIIFYGSITQAFKYNFVSSTYSIEDMALNYEDDKNSMIAITEKENVNQYHDFYDELDNRISIEQSMNMIFFGPPSSFLRIDPESILHIFAHMKKDLIPIARTLLAWDLITDGKTAAFLQGREYLAFGSLLNVVPEEDLYYVNFGDPSVLKYFANHYIDLQPRKFGILAAAYKRYYGNDWYGNSTYVNELGYMLCGFPSSDLIKISPANFKELTVELLRKSQRCNINQTTTMYNIATQPDAYGEPYKWSSHEISRLSALFICIPEGDISSIQLEAVTAISHEVMKMMNQDKLEYFTKQQILRMSPKTRRVYIIRMQLRSSLDMNEITKRSGSTIKRFSLLLCVLILCRNIVTHAIFF